MKMCPRFLNLVEIQQKEERTLLGDPQMQELTLLGDLQMQEIIPLGDPQMQELTLLGDLQAQMQELTLQEDPQTRSYKISWSWSESFKCLGNLRMLRKDRRIESILIIV